MNTVLVDSNILLDLFTRDPIWCAPSREALRSLAETHTLAINPVIYAEVSVYFSDLAVLDASFPAGMFQRDPIPYEAAFLAGKVFTAYKRRGGQRLAPLPDFFIGAHAAVARYKLLTRNGRDYRRDFPTVEIVTP